MKARARAGIGTAMLLISQLFAETVSGQAEQRPRPPNAPIVGTAQPRMPQAVGTIPSHVRAGVRVGHPRFFSDYYFYSGPFGSFHGYARGGIFYPFGYGPVPLSYFGARWIQYANVSRFGPPIGAWKLWQSYPRGEWGQPVVDLEDLRKENERLRDENAELREREAERRGYDRGRAEAQTQPQQPTTSSVQPQPAVPREPQALQDERPVVKLPYDGRVDKIQYVVVGTNVFNNGLFESMRRLTNGGENLLAVNMSMYKIELRDLNNGFAPRGVIDTSGYPNCLSINDLTDGLFADAWKFADVGSRYSRDDIVKNIRFEMMRDNRGNVYTASTCK